MWTWLEHERVRSARRAGHPSHIRTDDVRSVVHDVRHAHGCDASLDASAALRISDPSVPASPADRYSKGLAEPENKAKKKLVSITTETSM